MNKGKSSIRKTIKGESLMLIEAIVDIIGKDLIDLLNTVNKFKVL